jgi:predicted DNA-binding protein
MTQNFFSPVNRPATEIMNVRLAKGTNERIDKVLRGGEIRAMFIREAIEAELQRREQKPR